MPVNQGATDNSGWRGKSSLKYLAFGNGKDISGLQTRGETTRLVLEDIEAKGVAKREICLLGNLPNLI